MKKLKNLMLLSFLFVTITAIGQTELPPTPPTEEKTESSQPETQNPPAPVVTQITEEVEPTFIQKAIDWFTKNLAYILGFLGIVEIIVRLTPSEKDNAYFAWFSNLLDSIIPNFKKGGGTHKKA